MTSRFTFSAFLIAIVATTTSAAVAASKTTRHVGLTAYAAVPALRPTVTLPAPQAMSGAEWFQNKGITDEIGSRSR